MLKSMLMEAVKFILMGSSVKLNIFTFAFKMLLFLSSGWCFQTILVLFQGRVSFQVKEYAYGGFEVHSDG